MALAVDAERLEYYAWDQLVPERPRGLWDWAAAEIVLPMGESSAIAGFDPSRAGVFQRMFRVISARRLGLRSNGTGDFLCEQCWCVCSAQLGKSMNLIFSTAGWHVRHWPHIPLGVVWPTIDVRKQQLRGRLEPLFQSTPLLLDLMPEQGSEEYQHAITERMWKLGNGARLRALVGNIANDCRSNPMAIILADEFDALKANVGSQGDPLQLLIDRQRTFAADRLFVGTTTPSTVAGHGWRKLCAGTHERLLVRCDCGGLDWLNPDQIRVTDEKLAPKMVRRLDAARWHCRHCGVGHDTDSVRRMVTEAWQSDRWCPGTWEIDEDAAKGRWTPAAELDKTGHLVGEIPQPDDAIRSWHLNILYSPLNTLGEFMAAEMIALAGRDTDRQAHWNTARAEPWIPTQQDAATEQERVAVVARDSALGIIPSWAKWTLLLFDQQGNTEATSWFPWALRAYGDDGRSQLVDCGKVERAVEAPGAGWSGVDLLCAKTWPKADGSPQRATFCGMDGANGNMATRVRLWASRDTQRRLLFWGAPKLKDEDPWRVYVPSKRSRLPMPQGVRALEIHPTFWREQLDARRRQTPGYPSWQIAEGAPPYYLRSVWESEERVVVRRLVTGAGVREVTVWKPTAQTDSLGRITYRSDNHWWDLEAASIAIANFFRWEKRPTTAPRPRRRYGVLGDIN